jgi:hypothetical protein
VCGDTRRISERKDPMGPNNSSPSKDDRDNRSDQLNPNNDAYYQSRGLDERPDDWDDED